jgi:hypothetical protein
MTYYLGYFFSNEIIEQYILDGIAIDGTGGGLLSGNLHCDGGIKVLNRYADGYRLMLEVEGGEYILNSGATVKYNSQFESINNADRDKPYGLVNLNGLQDITILNCFLNHEIFTSKFLLFDARGGHLIINKFSTNRYLKELEQMNRNIKYKFISEPFEWTGDFK